MASFRPALTEAPATHNQAALGTARSIPGPRPCLFDVGFPLSGLQDRTHTSDLNTYAQHTRRLAWRLAAGAIPIRITR